MYYYNAKSKVIMKGGGEVRELAAAFGGRRSRGVRRSRRSRRG